MYIHTQDPPLNNNPLVTQTDWAKQNPTRVVLRIATIDPVVGRGAPRCRGKHPWRSSRCHLPTYWCSLWWPPSERFFLSLLLLLLLLLSL